jgi:hypothetical protein
MPNDCWCDVRIWADESTIQHFRNVEFKFQELRPQPEFEPIEGTDERWYTWRNENWGTKWDRYEYRVVAKGDMCLKLRFTTAWSPPYPLFEFLLEKYPDLFLHCDWSEEGGMAGVFNGQRKEGKLEIKELSWDDWQLEQYSLLEPVKNQ